MPWKGGRVLVWDATCPDTFAPSHLQLATREAGAEADHAEWRKMTKYIELAATHHFVPVAIESTRESLDPRHISSSVSSVVASRRKLGNPYPSTIYIRELLWPCSGGT